MAINALSRAKNLALVVFACLSASTFGAESFLTRTVVRQPDYIVERIRPKIFLTDVLEDTNGVVSLYEAVLEDEKLDLSSIDISYVMDGQSGFLCMMVPGEQNCHRYDIPYDAIVPLALWIDSQAAIAYTAWVSRDDVQTGAGLLRTDSPAWLFDVNEKKHFIALEFKGTRYEEILKFVDFCTPETCLTASNDGLVNSLNKEIEDLHGVTADMEIDWTRGDSTWINMDISRSIVARFAGSTVELTGGGARIIWRGISDTNVVRVIEAWPFKKGDKSVGYGAPIDSQVRFFRDAALLRAIHATNNEQWQKLMADIRAIASERPGPWVVYTRNVNEYERNSN